MSNSPLCSAGRRCCGEEPELHLVRRAEDGDGQGAAEIDEEALPLAAVAVGREEAGRGADADLDRAALVDLVERRAGMGGVRQHGGGQEGSRRSAVWIARRKVVCTLI